MTTALEALRKAIFEETENVEVDEKEVKQRANGAIPKTFARIKNEWHRVCGEADEQIAQLPPQQRVLLKGDFAKALFVIHAYFSPAFFPQETFMAEDAECEECRIAEGQWGAAKKHASEELTRARAREGDEKSVSADDIRAWMKEKGLWHHLEHLENCFSNMLWDYLLFARVIEQRAAEARMGTYDFLKRAFRPLTNQARRKGEGRTRFEEPWKQVVREILGKVPEVSFPKTKKTPFKS